MRGSGRRTPERKTMMAHYERNPDLRKKALLAMPYMLARSEQDRIDQCLVLKDIIVACGLYRPISQKLGLAETTIGTKLDGRHVPNMSSFFEIYAIVLECLEIKLPAI